MPKRVPVICLQVAAFCAVACTTWVAECPAQQKQHPASNSVTKFLRDYLGSQGVDVDRSTKYFMSFAALSGSRKQDIVVYVTGQSWCGSGGCTTLILAPNGSSYRLVAKITISQPPIRVLASRSNGWHDISVHVQGGGIQPGYEAQLLFDGKTYPSNPSTPPARRLTEKVPGDVIVSARGEGSPLYE